MLQRGAFLRKKDALLQSGAGITNLNKSYYKVGNVIHYKVGQLLLQSGVGINKLGNFITKWGNYYRKGQYIFVTLGLVEIHVY